MKKPNILFLLIDDMGWRDVGVYGSTFYETPNIDALAKEGMLFTQAYAACPLCSPSRASIMSGKLPVRMGVTDVLGSSTKGKLLDAKHLTELPLSEMSIANALRDGGYATWHVGKWHLGEEDFFPDKHGFDVNMGGCGFGLPRNGYFSPYTIPTLEEGPKGEHLTERLTNEAIKLIEGRDKDKPFFLNMWHYAVHVPIQACDQSLVEKYQQKAKDMGLDQCQTYKEGDYFPCEHKKDMKMVRRIVQSDPYYAAMIEHLDGTIGKLIDTLKKEGIYDDTIIVFTSDNGGLSVSEGSPTCNAPLCEGKGWAYEGGVREPLIVSWPGHIAPNTTTDAQMISADFYPTLLDMVQLPLRPEQHKDGVSFLPALKGEAFERGTLYWHYPHYGNQGGTPCSAMRDGDWKIIYFYEDEHLELYHLTEDISESNDLSSQMPEKAKAMKEKMDAYLTSVDAKTPQPNPNFVPWRTGVEPNTDVELPFDLEKYDADVYYCKNMYKYQL